MTLPFPVLSAIGLIIFVALIFDYINGFHDAANSIATIVSTRVLSPRLAVLWAATFNFLALWFFGEGVAKTISGIITVDSPVPDDVLERVRTAIDADEVREIDIVAG